MPAAGSGSRFGTDLPKQFIPLRGKPVYLHALDVLAPFCGQCVLLVPSGWEERVGSEIQGLPYRDRLLVEVGGPERQDSVYRGLKRLSDRVRVVLVHDAVRPFVSPGLVTRVIEGARRYRACIPTLPVKETVKEVREGKVIRTVERQGLHLVQTPQGFQAQLLKEAFEQALRDRFYGTDESMLVERLGVPVHTVEGEAGNIKITWKEDLRE